MSDVILQIPPAVLYWNTEELPPVIDTTQGGALEGIYPPNFSNGQQVQVIKTKKGIRARDTTVYINGLQQTVDDDSNFDYLLVTTDNLGGAGLGEYEYTLVESDAAKFSPANVMFHVRNTAQVLQGGSFEWSYTNSCWLSTSGGTLTDGVAEWTTDRTWGGFPTFRVQPDTYWSNWQYFAANSSGLVDYTGNWVSNGDDFSLGFHVFIETTDLSDNATMPKIPFIAGVTSVGAMYGFWYRHDLGTAKFWHNSNNGMTYYDAPGTINLNAWNHFMFQFEAGTNKLYVGLNGSQTEYDLDSLTWAGLADPAIARYHFGSSAGYDEDPAWDDTASGITGNIAEPLAVNRLIYGKQATYTVPTESNLLPTGAWTMGTEHPYVRYAGAFWGTPDAGFQAGGITINGSTTVGKSYDYAHPAWSYNSDITRNHSGSIGYAGTTSDAMVMCGNTASNTSLDQNWVDVWNGTAWSTGVDALAAREDCTGFGLADDAHLVGDQWAPLDTGTEYFNGTSWSSGSSLPGALSAPDGCGLTGSDGVVTAGLAVYSWDGSSWATETALPNTGTAALAGRPDDAIVVTRYYTGLNTEQGCIPIHWHGHYWSTLDISPIEMGLSQGAPSVATGVSGSLLCGIAGNNLDVNEGTAIVYNSVYENEFEYSEVWP